MIDYSDVKMEHAIIETTAEEISTERGPAAPLRLKNEGLAAILSLLMPGVGHFYIGKWGWGAFWIILTVGFQVGSGGTLGFIMHILAAIQAYKKAEATNDERLALGAAG